MLSRWDPFAEMSRLRDNLGLGVARGYPAREGIREEDLCSLVYCERRAGVFEKAGDLEVRDDEGRGHDLEPEDASGGGAAAVRAEP